MTTKAMTGSNGAAVVLPHLGAALPFLGVAGEDRQHGVDARVDAAGEIALLELRRDRRGDDHLGQGVGQRAFEPVADLDADLALVRGDQQQRAVVLVFAWPSRQCRNSRLA